MRVKENSFLNTLVYYGDYILDKIYDINDFIINVNVNLVRCFQYSLNSKSSIKQKKERYIILTDIYFLVFDPLDKNKNLAKLLFWGDIRQMSNFRCDEIVEEKCDSLILEWKNGNQIQITFELTFKDLNIKEFMELSLSKIENIKKRYKIFQDDIWKFGEQTNTLNYSNKDYLLNLIKIKEKLFNKNKSLILSNDLISLYNKIIEVLSINNDPDFKVYLEKLQNLLNDKEIQIKMNNENKLFESNKPINNIEKYNNHDDTESLFDKY